MTNRSSDSVGDAVMIAADGVDDRHGYASAIARPRQLSAAERTVDTSHMCWSRSHTLDQVWPVQLVFEPSSASADLLSGASLRGMCELAQQTAAAVASSNCRHQTIGGCCAARSLGTYAALLSGRATCGELTDADADAFKARLGQCVSAHASSQLGYQDFFSWQPSPPATPPAAPGSQPSDPVPNDPRDPCVENNAVFDALHALIDVESVRAAVGTGAAPSPRFVKLMLPHQDEEDLKRLHLDFLESRLHDTYGDAARLTAYHLSGIRFSLFNEILMSQDMPRIAMGFGVILIVVWLYSGSLLFTILALLQILLAIGVAFAVYQVFLWMPFFPFINMTGLFLCVGIGVSAAWRERAIQPPLLAVPSALHANPSGAPTFASLGGRHLRLLASF